MEKTRIVTRPQLTRAYAAMFLGEPSGVGRYQQLLAAIMLRLHGPRSVPHNRKAVEKACDDILRTVWDGAKAESLVRDLLLARIKKVVEREGARGTPLGEMVRMQRFADSVREELGFAPSKHGDGLSP